MSLPLVKPSPLSPPAVEAVTAESLGRQLRATLPPMRLHSLSLYNGEGDVLWLSEGALGPDEHSVVLDAMQTLSAQTTRNYHERGLEDGRLGIFLPVRAPRGDLVGVTMILTELKHLPDGIAERLAVPKVRTILQRIAVFLRVGSSRGGDTTPSLVMPPTAAAPLPPTTVDEMLSLELAPDPPPNLAADLTLYVQELIKLHSHGRTRRYEVLARSKRDAERNEVPAAFVAESANGRKGAALDAAVTRQLLSWLEAHPQIWEGDPASFSINLSAGALRDEAFLELVSVEIEKAGLPSGSLGFEIAESTCVQFNTETRRFIAACERLGCFVVLDHFTLDSVARQLLTFKAVRMVKLDSTLTAAAMKEKLPQALVVAISQACKVLGIHCIAKKVETQAALDWLNGVGCDLAQGFALERPLSLDTLATPAPARKRGKL